MLGYPLESLSLARRRSLWRLNKSRGFSFPLYEFLTMFEGNVVLTQINREPGNETASPDPRRPMLRESLRTSWL